MNNLLDVLTREGVFFSEAAVVTFGGAYAAFNSYATGAKVAAK
mgnify:CR=1 FL=1